jgi:hypothetical protein
VPNSSIQEGKRTLLSTTQPINAEVLIPHGPGPTWHAGEHLRKKHSKPSKSLNLVQWWWTNQGSFPTLFQDALDKLAILAMLDKCERVFSSTGKMITPERNRLGDDIIEASECLKA